MGGEIELLTVEQRLRQLIAKWRAEAKELEDEPEFDGGVAFGKSRCADELEERMVWLTRK